MQPSNERPHAVEKWYRVDEVMQITGFGRSFIYDQMSAGQLRNVKCGAGRRIPESALVEFQAKFNGNDETA